MERLLCAFGMELSCAVQLKDPNDLLLQRAQQEADQRRTDLALR